MGVRRGDKVRQETLNKLIVEKSTDIAAILAQYHIPLLPITQSPAKKD
jgi:hypothetical protein